MKVKLEEMDTTKWAMVENEGEKRIKMKKMGWGKVLKIGKSD